MTCYCKGQSGLSQLEVMISMVILALGVVGLAPMIGMAIYTNNYSSHVAEANALAQQEIEQMLSRKSYPKLPSEQIEEVANSPFIITRRVEDANSDSLIPDGLVRVYVDVNWSENSERRSVAFSVLRTFQEAD